MSLHDIIPSSGASDLGGGLNIVVKLAKSVESVKVHQSQCRDLAKRCRELRLSLRDNSTGLEGTQAQQVVDEVDRVIHRVHNRVHAWAEYSKMRSIVKQNEIKLGIDESYRELDAISMRFNMAFHLHAITQTRDLENLRAHDHAELVDMVAQSLQNFNQLKAVLATTDNTREDVQSVMRTIQEELHDSNLEETQEQQLQQGLWELHRWTNQLPPMADLTGQVQRTSDHAIIEGGSQDIFLGEWLDAEEVALGLPRNQSPEAQKRFHQQVEIWRRLQHPSVLRLYGIAYIEDYVYSVSPWMRNGSAMSYLKTHPETDRLRLISEIASGMEYLHTNGIVHGDLRATNVLISDTGKACICDFGLSQFEDVNIDAVTGSSGNSRWLAPEMITPEEFVSPTKAVDIWSFGMTCLEIFTGMHPYSNYAKDITVAVVVVQGVLPMRPDAEVTARGLSDGMWEMMKRCWQREPEMRPTMADIRATMKPLLPEKSPRAVPITLPPRSSFSSGVVAGHIRASPSLSSGTGESPSRSLLTMSKPQHLEATLARTPSSAGSPTYGLAESEPGSARLRLTPTSSTSIPLSSGSVSVPPPSTHKSFFGKSVNSSPPTTGRSFFVKTVSSSPPHQPTLKPPPFPTPRLSTSPNHSSPLSPSHPSPSPLSPVYQHQAYASSSHSRASTSGSSDLQGFGAAEPLSPLMTSKQSSSSRHGSIVLGSITGMPPTPPLSDPDSPPLRRETSLTSSSDHGHAYEAPSGLDAAALLDSAIRNPEQLLKRGVDGAVEAGTLQGLVKRLIMSSADPMKDVDFRLVFLTTYRVFTTSEELFNVLKSRFEEASECLTITSAPGTGIKYPILLLLKTWVKMEYEDMDTRVLTLIQDFARSIRGSQTMEAQAREIVGIIDDQLRLIRDGITQLPARSPTISGVAPANPDTIKSADLAAALTVVEGDCYSQITYLDVVLHLLQSSGNKHIEAASVTNNRIVNWVKKRVLKSNDVSRRAEVFKFFVNTAEECRRLGNFSSMSAIVTALQSSTKADSTTPLMMTRSQKLSNNEKRTLRRLDNLLAPSSNHRAYRDALREANTSRVVPWLAAHLHYLTTIYHRLPPAVEVDGHGLINFQRYTVLVTQIRAVLEYKSPELHGARSSGTLAYLHAELKATPAHGVHEHFEKRSAALAAAERDMHDQHMAELLALGFPPPRPSAPAAPRPSTAGSEPSPSQRNASSSARTNSTGTTDSTERRKRRFF